MNKIICFKRNIILCFLIIVSIVNISAATVTVEKNNIQYTVNLETNEAEVYGTVSSSTTITNLVIPDFIEYNNTQIPVTSIGYRAFYSENNLRGSLTIGDNVLTIGDRAFYNCSSFTGSLTIGDNVQTIENSAFEGCSGFTGSLTIGDNVLTIGDRAFYNCSGFTGSLTIGDNVQTIGEWAFASCSGFTGSLTLGDNVQTIGSGAFASCSGFTGSLTIGENVQTIKTSTFRDCSGFTGSLTIPDNVQTIGISAFSGCSSFTGSLTLGDNVQTIGEWAFHFCSGFTGSLTIGNNVQTIGSGAFASCSGFTGSLTIGENVQTIGDRAFYNCSSFTGSLTIGDNVQTIGVWAFYNCSGFTGSLTIGNNVQTIGSNAFCMCSGFTGSLTLGDNVQTIGDAAFSICRGFTGSLTIPNSVQTIGNGAFENCSGFTGSLRIGDKVHTIGDWAFQYCSGFTGSLTITNSVQTIGNRAFEGCSGFTSLFLPASISSYGSAFSYMPLREITCQAVNPPTIQSTTFNSSTMQTACLYVPSQSVAKYQSANYWKDFNCINNIKVLPTSLAIEPTEITIGIKDSFELEIIILPEEAVDADLTFTSSNIQVATVDEDGKIIALTEGKTTITVETENGLTATCEVTVIPILANKVVLSTEDLILLVGQTDKLTATVTPENTTDKTIIWKSESESIATVGTDGTVTALATGVANITATCGDATVTCKVTVYGPNDVTVKPGDGTNPGDEDDTPGNNTESGGSLFGSDLTLRVNQSATIDLVIPEGLSIEPKFAWSLDNGGAELVSMTVKDNTLSAIFKGLKVGQTGYTVSIVGVNGNIEAVKGKIIVIAEIPITSLELDPASITIAQNALPVTITAKYTPEDATMPEFVWRSSDTGVATVDDKGVVKPVSQGKTVITATALDGSELSATSNITVTAPLAEDFEFEFDESVMGGKEGISLYIGETYTFTPKAQDGYVLPDVINWSSSDPETVSVDSNGKITALKLGKAIITASAIVNHKEINATCEVTVIPIDSPDIPDLPEVTADTPTQMLRKGDGTSHTFVAMMEKSDEVLEAQGYNYIFGYNKPGVEKAEMMENTPWRYAHTTKEIYDNTTYDFWVFAYYIESDGTVRFSSRRHLDGSVDDDFNPADFINIVTRSHAERILGIFTLDGRYVGKEIDYLAPGIYIINTTSSSYKIIK